MREALFALQSVALMYFRDLRVGHPEWYLEDLIATLHIADTEVLKRLARTAGFKSRTEPNADELIAVAALWIRGVRSVEVIAKETDIDCEKIRAILAFYHGYGHAQYGKTRYGGTRTVSDGKKEVPRRVTISGQLSYRGHLYTLGTEYGGRIASVREQGNQLRLTFTDRPPLVLVRRNIKPV